MAAKKSSKTTTKRLARQSDRDHAASLVDQFHDLMLLYPEPRTRELLLTSWIQHLNAELECFAENGTWEGRPHRVVDEKGWPAGWSTHEDQMREFRNAQIRDWYARMRAERTPQLEAVDRIAKAVGISDDTVRSVLFRVKKPAA